MIVSSLTAWLKGRRPQADALSMPRMRGMLAGLGASASLAVAGALALLVISAVIALEGFPGINADAGGRSLAVADLTVPTTDPTVAAVAPDRVTARAPEPAAPTVPAPLAADAGDDASPAASPERGPDAGDVPPGAGFDPGGASDPGGGSDPVTRPDEDLDEDLLPDEPVGDLTATTGGVVGTLGEGLAPLADRILPGSGKLLRGTTALVDETVTDTGQALGGTVDGLLRD